MVVDTAGHMYDSTHRMISRPRPLALDNLGLVDALEDMVAAWRLQHPGLQFGLRCGDLPGELGDAVKITAYRVVQEAVTNALRHAAAQRIDIDLQQAGGELAIVVRDDGRGLSGEADEGGRYGLRGMRERAGALGGRVNITSAAQGGVCVEARLPLAAEQPA
ncbi:MAG: ATP-binding protein [Comamonadaceae bacterium]|nr:ATP-binding protein [Comamonadaceae bacterium]